VRESTEETVPFACEEDFSQAGEEVAHERESAAFCGINYS